MHYDALLVVSFGGPESNEEVIPFLENVLRGKNVPRERMLAVAEHYYHFGGKSPINEQNRQLIAALQAELDQRGPRMPIYWGNRNWHPLLPDTLEQMKQDGIRRALAFMTSAFSSYSGCRQYRENVAVAQATVGIGAPDVDKLRVFYNHPGFIDAMAERVQTALEALPENVRRDAIVIYTAHSIPMSMAQSSKYVPATGGVLPTGVLCTRSNRMIGWLIRAVAARRLSPGSSPTFSMFYARSSSGIPLVAVVIAPIGFISDHMEVLYDLDTEAADLCAEIKLPMARAGTVGTHPKFVSMIRDLIVERMNGGSERVAIGTMGPSHDICPEDCCPAPQRPGAVR